MALITCDIFMQIFHVVKVVKPWKIGFDYKKKKCLKIRFSQLPAHQIFSHAAKTRHNASFQAVY